MELLEHKELLIQEHKEMLGHKGQLEHKELLILEHREQSGHKETMEILEVLRLTIRSAPPSHFLFRTKGTVPWTRQHRIQPPHCTYIQRMTQVQVLCRSSRQSKM